MQKDLTNFGDTLNFFNVLAYAPTHQFNNMAAAYEHCNGYIYFSYLTLIVGGDYGFASELATRLFIILSEEIGPFYDDIRDIMSEDHPDYYLIGFRIGMIWQSIFDIKLNSA